MRKHRNIACVSKCSPSTRVWAQPRMSSDPGNARGPPLLQYISELGGMSLVVKEILLKESTVHLFPQITTQLFFFFYLFISINLFLRAILSFFWESPDSNPKVTCIENWKLARATSLISRPLA